MIAAVVVAVVASGCGDGRDPVDAAVAREDAPGAIDAAPDGAPDARAIDAAIDAVIDAAIDAAIDARVIDAAPPMACVQGPQGPPPPPPLPPPPPPWACPSGTDRCLVGTIVCVCGTPGGLAQCGQP